MSERRAAETWIERALDATVNPAERRDGRAAVAAEAERVKLRVAAAAGRVHCESGALIRRANAAAVAPRLVELSARSMAVRGGLDQESTRESAR